MCSYDWIVLVTLGLDRWEQARRPAPHEIELREIRKLHAAEHPPAPRRCLLARLWPRRRQRARGQEAARAGAGSASACCCAASAASARAAS